MHSCGGPRKKWPRCRCAGSPCLCWRTYNLLCLCWCPVTCCRDALQWCCCHSRCTLDTPLGCSPTPSRRPHPAAPQRQQQAAAEEVAEARREAAKSNRELASASDYLAGIMSELAVSLLARVAAQQSC